MAVSPSRALENDLGMALDRDQFHLDWQPFVDVVTQSILGYEALLRWNRPQHGPIRSDEFIPAAERSGLIRRVDQWVLRMACRDAARWVEALSVAINISGQSFQSDALPALIEASLRESGLAPHRLEIEIPSAR